MPWSKPRARSSTAAAAITASASKVDNPRDVEKMRQARREWQRRALAYYDTVGEIRFSAQFYARMLARVRFFPAKVDENGELTPIKEGPPVEALTRIHDQGGRQGRLQYDYGRLQFITGEGCLFVTDAGGEKERWRFLWNDELEFNMPRDGQACEKDANGAVTDVCGTAYRMWTPSPLNSKLADSPLRSVLDIAEELLILTASVRSTAVTRLTNGILLLPTEISPPPVDIGRDEDPGMSAFMSALIEHITAQIENPGAAEARVPFVHEGAYEYLDRVTWVQTHDPKTDYLERDLRLEAIKRLAISLDFPPEVLLGLSDSNHWTAQQVQWDMWRSHGIPLAEQYANDMNSAYLRPAMEAESYPGWQDIVIGYDDSQVVVSPDQTAIADEAMDRAAISFSGYRKLKGIPESMAPDEEEKKFVFGIKTRDPVVAGLEKEAPPVAGPQAAPGVSQNGKSLAPAPPTGGRVVSRQEARVASIVGAAHMAIRQCRSKAGARLRTKITKPPGHEASPCDECGDQIADVDNSLVASAIGLDGLTALSMRDPLNLVRGGTDDFRGILSEWGIDQANAGVLCERIEAHAAQTLFDPNTPDVPVGFASHVEHALEVADRVHA
jgi:hypothetical protein